MHNKLVLGTPIALWLFIVRIRLWIRSADSPAMSPPNSWMPFIHADQATGHPILAEPFLSADSPNHKNIL
jgi:hypothetical protein